jgi:hypothetical protein
MFPIGTFPLCCDSVEYLNPYSTALIISSVVKHILLSLRYLRKVVESIFSKK